MRAIAVIFALVALSLPRTGEAQPLSERIVQPPPAPGMPPRSGTYADPFASKPQLGLTAQPQRPAKGRKKRRR